jgi:signal transduction histidine kinase
MGSERVSHHAHWLEALTSLHGGRTGLAREPIETYRTSTSLLRVEGQGDPAMMPPLPGEPGSTNSRRSFTRAVAGVAALALVATLAIAVYTSRHFAASTARVERAMLVKVAVADLAGALSEARADQRGYALIGRVQYMDSYKAAALRASEQVRRLGELTKDSAIQQGLVTDLKRLVASQLDELHGAIELRNRAGEAAAEAVADGDDAMHPTGALQGKLREMETLEETLLASWRGREQRYRSLAIASLVSVSILFGLLATIVGLQSRTAEARRRSAESDAARLRAENDALAERQRTAQFQERFIAILGHDLRNPLSSVVMGLRVLRTVPASKHADIVERLERSASRMTRMIDQLLDLAHGRLGGGIPLRTAKTNLGKIVTDVAGEARATHPDRPLVVELLGDLDGEWDPDRLAQVVSNLVENALRHGGADGAVRVTVDGNAKAVAMAVHNHGPAVPDELACVIFDPFRRGELDDTTSRRSGLGLGLYIVREIASAHGGTVDIVSNESDGTTFTLKLPRGGKARAVREQGCSSARI